MFLSELIVNRILIVRIGIIIIIYLKYLLLLLSLLFVSLLMHFFGLFCRQLFSA